MLFLIREAKDYIKLVHLKVYHFILINLEDHFKIHFILKTKNVIFNFILLKLTICTKFFEFNFMALLGLWMSRSKTGRKLSSIWTGRSNLNLFWRGWVGQKYNFWPKYWLSVLDYINIIINLYIILKKNDFWLLANFS